MCFRSFLAAIAQQSALKVEVSGTCLWIPTSGAGLPIPMGLVMMDCYILSHFHFHQKSLQTQIWKSGHGSSCCQDPIERPLLQCRVTVGEAGNGLEGVTCVGVLLESLVTLVILNTCMHVPLTLPEITTQNDLTMSPQPFGLWLHGSQMFRLFDFLSITRA